MPCLNLLYMSTCYTLSPPRVTVDTIWRAPQVAAHLPTSCIVCCLSLLSSLSLWYMCGLGLYPFICFFFVLLLRFGRGLSPNVHCQKRISFHSRDMHCLEDIGVVWCLSYPSGRGTMIHWALRSLVMRETWFQLLGPVSPRMHASPKALWIFTNCN